MLAASVTPSAIEDGFATRRSAYLRSDAASLSRIKSGPARTGCATKAALVLFSGDAKQRRPRRPPEHARGNTLSHCSGGRRRGGAVDVSRRSWSGDRSVTTAPPDWIATLPASLADIGRSVLFGHGVGVAGCGRPAPSAARRTACESCGDKEAPVTRKRPFVLVAFALPPVGCTSAPRDAGHTGGTDPGRHQGRRVLPAAGVQIAVAGPPHMVAAPTITLGASARIAARRRGISLRVSRCPAPQP